MQGLSASIPLTINTPGHFLETEIGLIGLSATILSVWSMSIVAAKLVCIPTLLSRAVGRDGLRGDYSCAQRHHLPDGADVFLKMVPRRGLVYLANTRALCV
jgi:hypothetical protein